MLKIHLAHFFPSFNIPCITGCGLVSLIPTIMFILLAIKNINYSSAFWSFVFVDCLMVRAGVATAIYGAYQKS